MGLRNTLGGLSFWLKVIGMLFCGVNIALTYVSGSIPSSKDNVYYTRDVIVTACMLFFVVEATFAVSKVFESCPHILQLYMLCLGFVFTLISASFCFVLYTNEKDGPDATLLPLIMGLMALCTALVMILDLGREYYTYKALTEEF